MCDRLGVDVWEVIDAAATKPFGFMKFTPGPVWAGTASRSTRCISPGSCKSLNYNARFIELASEINTNMPRFAVSKVQDALNERGKAVKGSQVLVLGVAYKPDIDDLRESPALDVIHLLEQKGRRSPIMIPIPRSNTMGGRWNQWTITTCSLSEVQATDVTVIVTNHSSYNYPQILEAACLIVDTRNALGKIGCNQAKVVKL